MGFRFRKSFKVMPGVKINLSKSGLSTTIGGRGASVNIGKKGAYLNTSVAGFSNRKKISGSTRNTGSSTPTYVAPRIPQPASTRWFSFGVAFAIFGIVATISNYLEPPVGKVATVGDAAIVISFWVAFGAVWWFVRRALRASKQGRYEAYIAKQQADTLAAEQAAEEARIVRAEAIRLQQERDEQAARERKLAQEQAIQERRAQHLATFEPHMDRARQLYCEGILSNNQLEELESERLRSYASVSSFELSIDMMEIRARAEIARKALINSKYDESTALKLIQRQISTGMSREQVIDSLGETTKKELALTKDGERETLVYGSKITGSYFHIVNGIVTKAVVR